MMKMIKSTGLARRLKAGAALAVLAVSLAGCVVYPNRGYGYGPGYYAGPVVAPTMRSSSDFTYGALAMPRELRFVWPEMWKTSGTVPGDSSSNCASAST